MIMIIGDISVLHIVSLLLNIGLEQDYQATPLLLPETIRR